MIQENKAKQEALCAFLNSDYKEAIRIALKYLNEIGRGPVSLGDNMKMGGPPPAEFLAYFRTVRPAILASMPNELFEVLRIEAAMEELFCEEVCQVKIP